MLSIQHIFDTRYRGFTIACHIQRGPHVDRICYTPMWRCSMTGDGADIKPEDNETVRRLKLDRWVACTSWSYSLEDAEKLARECIDFNYLVEAAEAEKGRELDWKELAMLARSGS